MANSVRRSRKRARDRRGGWLIAVALIITAAFIVSYVLLRRQQVSVNAETLCPRSGPHSLTVLLIDQTDPLTAIQQQDLRSRLEAIKDQLERYGGIAVYAIGPLGPDMLRPVAPLICNPGRGDEINPIIGNPTLIERQWRTRFSEPLDRLFDTLVKPAETPTSPILESIQAVAVTAFREGRGERIPRRLIIASDMLHHTPEHSQYNQITPFEVFRPSPYYRRVMTDLQGVEIEILYVRRDTRRHVQGKIHIEFWQRYITDVGGVLTRVVALQG
jgi:hypothetical protein